VISAGVTLDTGALIGAERGVVRVVELVATAVAAGVTIAVPAAVLAQAWRQSPRQVLLARLMAKPGVTVLALTEARARNVGRLLAATGSRDVVDASVVQCARELGHRVVVTSGPEDLRRLDPTLTLFTV